MWRWTLTGQFSTIKRDHPAHAGGYPRSLCTRRGGAARHRAYSQRHPRGVHVHPRRAVRADLNGASVVDLTTGEQLVNQPFGTEQALKIYDLLEQGGGMMSIFIGGKSYTTRANAENHMDVVPENLKNYFRTTRIEVDDMHVTLRTHAHEIEKYSMLYHDEAERDAAWRAIEAACPGVELTSSLPRNMEVNAPGVTKGSGLLALAAHLGLTRAQTMAVGDSGNDRAMIEAAGLGWPWATPPTTSGKLPMSRRMTTIMTVWQRL